MIATFEVKKEMCNYFFNMLRERLSESYEEIESCNKDFSRYLCPNGTSEEISYTGKPDSSFRISDHWNWFANVNKCENEKYIQCYSKDFPFAHKRIEAGRASKPIKAVSVCLFINGSYKVVYGEIYDRKKKRWCWLDTNADDVADRFLKGDFER